MFPLDDPLLHPPLWVFFTEAGTRLEIASRWWMLPEHGVHVAREVQEELRRCRCRD